LDGIVVFRTKTGKFTFQASQKKAQVALSWPKRDEKDFLKSERRTAESAASHHEKRDNCDL